MKRELFTTVQMIESLKVGQVAECLDDKQCRAIKQENGAIVWEDETDRFVALNQATMRSSWVIRENYTSFYEAMKALDEGEVITLHFAGNEFRFGKDNRFILGEMANEELLFSDLLRGDWTIG